MVVWDRNAYIGEAEKQLSDENIYKDINFKDNILQIIVRVIVRVGR